MFKGHHDIWSEIKQDFIESYDDVSNLSLSVKLKFLKRHGFGFMSSLCPRKIRNAVAHQNFEIPIPFDVSGSIRVGNEFLKISDLDKILENINQFFTISKTSLKAS